MSDRCAICAEPATVSVRRRRGLCDRCAWKAARELEQAGALSVRLQAGGWPPERELWLGGGARLVLVASLLPERDGEPTP